MPKYIIGDIIVLSGTGIFYPGVECIVVEMSERGNWPKKIKAVIPDERLGKHGFIEENGQYYAIEWEWSQN